MYGQFDYIHARNEYPPPTPRALDSPLPCLPSHLRPISPHVRHSSFLLHRPHIRLDELPLFDALFTGVQQGEGTRGGGGGGGGGRMGGGDTSGVSSDPGAVTTKARVWMLRALRDGKLLLLLAGRC